jgi:hypothetical protein
MIRHLALLLLAACLGAADYQFGLEIPKDDHQPLLYGRTSAFLWVPPASQKLKAVVIAPANIIERKFCDDPQIRAAAAKDDVALLYIQGGWKGDFIKGPDLAPFIQSILDRFAASSGYGELATIPWIPLGHSGNSVFCGTLLRERTDRILAAVVIKGALPPVLAADKTPILAQAAAYEQVPMLFVTGEFEEVMPPGKVRDAWWPEQLKRMVVIRTQVKKALITGLEDRGLGHLTWTPGLSAYVADYLHRIQALRLGDDGHLRPVDFAHGWLTDPDGAAPTAPAGDFSGIQETAMWHPDEEATKVWAAEQFIGKGLKDQELAFLDASGQPAPWWDGWALQTLPFTPLADGVSFKLTAAFRDEVPAPFADAGTKLGHADPAGITYHVLGWGSATEQTAPGTFRVRFDREGFNGRTTRILIGAYHPGDATFRRTIGAVVIDVPAENKAGAPQVLTFPGLKNRKATAKPLTLEATSDAKLPVDYFVSWGPAEVVDGVLTLTPVPVRATLPLPVRVTAYQWGKATEPAVATAKPVVRTFQITARE